MVKKHSIFQKILHKRIFLKTVLTRVLFRVRVILPWFDLEHDLDLDGDLDLSKRNFEHDLECALLWGLK